MNDYLRLIASHAATALNIPGAEWKDFDQLFLDIQADDHPEAAAVLILLYNFANAQGGYSHLRYLYSLKTQHTEQETAQLTAFKTAAEENLATLKTKIEAVAGRDEPRSRRR